MKAAVFERYGSPDVVRLKEVEGYAAEDGGVLVKVRASSLNAMDWRRVTANPILVRFLEGIRKPKNPKLGQDFSGTVTALGKGATEFHIGDEVFGVADGSFAEFVSASEKDTVLKPANVSHEAAAAVPIAGLTALQAIRDHGHVGAGQLVLINGAGGGVGSLSVQIAKSYGARVIATTGPDTQDFVRSMGADEVLDYTRVDFCADSQRYDVIVDLHPSHSVSAYRRALKPGGICVQVGFGGIARLLGLTLRGKFASKRTSKKVEFMAAKTNKTDLLALAELLRTGKLLPAIDRRFSLQETPDAIRYIQAGHAHGKVVVTM